MDNTRMLLKEMAFNEEKIMELYWMYEQKIPKYAETWKMLAEEERKHANMLKSFSLLSASREINANLDKVTLEVIRKEAAFIGDEIEKAKNENFGASEAFLTAKKIEGSMLEDKIFSLFKSHDRDLKKVISTLEADTKRHFEQVKKLAETAG